MSRVLVVVDMQNDFIDGALANPAAAAIVDDIAVLIRNGEYDSVICTLDTHYQNYLNTIEGKMLPVPHCIYGTAGWNLNKKIYDALDDCVHALVCKNTFGSLELIDYIKAGDSVDFVGTCTGICVINNVAIVKAAYPNNLIRVFENLCACVTPASHQRAIEQMRFNHISIEKIMKE